MNPQKAEAEHGRGSVWNLQLEPLLVSIKPCMVTKHKESWDHLRSGVHKSTCPPFRPQLIFPLVLRIHRPPYEKKARASPVRCAIRTRALREAKIAEKSYGKARRSWRFVGMSQDPSNLGWVRGPLSDIPRTFLLKLLHRRLQLFRG